MLLGSVPATYGGIAATGAVPAGAAVRVLGVTWDCGSLTLTLTVFEATAFVPQVACLLNQVLFVIPLTVADEILVQLYPSIELCHW